MSLLMNNVKAQHRVISRAFCTRVLSSVDAATAPSHLTGKHVSSTPIKRSLSTIGGSNYNNNTQQQQGLRAYPQFTVHGENLLAVKLMPPGFRLVRNSVLALDTARKGRILLEFAPRGADGKYVWADLVRFGLSAEEVGLLINQLPHYKVEFSRLPPAPGGEEYSGGVVSTDMPDKVLTVEPGELGAINFTLDYVRDGVGGQSPGHGQDGKAGPLTVEVQAGEFEVMTTIMRHSIPYLTGWAQQMDISIQNSISEATSGGGGGYSGGGGGASDVPF